MPFYLFRVFKIRCNKIVFDNFEGRGYGDNPKYIAEEIIRQKLQYDMVWLIKPGYVQDFPKEIRAVKIGTLRACFELVTARVWVDNIRKSANTRKRKGQYYIQTWHGGYGGKKVEKDVEDKLSPEYVQMAKLDSRMADVFISNSRKMTNLYKSSFWYDGPLLEVGLPRSDIFFGDMKGIETKIKLKFGIPFHNKIVLYAPTFRKNYNLAVYNDLDIDRCLEALRKRFNSEWTMLIRLHPNIAHLSDRLDINCNHYINVSGYPDMQELLCAAQILITDFSSSYLDFLLMNKICIFYLPDLNFYLEDRNMYIDIKNIFIPKVQDNDELEKTIENFDYTRFQCEREQFLNEIQLFESGIASKEVVNWIRKLM